ncbi:MAG: LysM peptidoglycan-binding domain-containing protein [Actinomycetota bacterium]|nr:LysM peptidoglycan-binding domain-containing protein [Actinomycetota bacterium]
MAVRSEDLGGASAIVYRFPPVMAARRRRAQRMAAARRRTALMLVGIGVVVASLLGAGPRGYAPAAGPSGAPRSVVIQQGETLWDLAERFAPGTMDPRAYVDLLIEMNGLEGALQQGQRVRLPH